MHLRIGITGGIGVGKTTVCKIFEHLKVPVYNADLHAKFLMVNDKELKAKIEKKFGWDAYNRDNSLNREYLASIVFNNPQRLKELNALVHPVVIKDHETWDQQNFNKPYTLKEAALLIESQTYKKLDKIIVVTSPIDIRIERITKRDNLKQENVLKRIENQISDKERIEKADFLIKNNGEISLILQTLQLHKKLLKLSQNNCIN